MRFGGLVPPDTGSSPRGRGKLCPTLDAHATVRLIPAGAGKTSKANMMLPKGRAHPRGGGENRRRAGRARRIVWLIPAGAGKTA